MHRYMLVTIIGIALVAAGLRSYTTSAVAAEDQGAASVFRPDGKATVPPGFRSWVFIGSSVTPNGLNKPEAFFPEFHNVYVERKNVDAHLKTGLFPRGNRDCQRAHSRAQFDVSRRVSHGTVRTGILQWRVERHRYDGEGQQAIRQDQRLGLLHVWPSSKAVQRDLGREDVAECAGCHIANVAKTDMTWVQFYPLLRDEPGY